MPVRLASPDEAETLWEIRNQAIRHGCKNIYDTQIVMAWTPEQMPAGYRKAIAENPFLSDRCTGWRHRRQQVFSI